MFISGIFKAVTNVMSCYEKQMNYFYAELGKLDPKTQMSVLASMHYRR